MPHLYEFRRGWQNEALTHFLLSHFAFLGKPSTVADDVGSDFYCTLFQKRTVGRHQHLLPKNSFVLQVKSSESPIDLSDKAAFLSDLELPFFVGIPNRKKMSLRIFSGRGLHLLFAMKGIPEHLKVELTSRKKIAKYYRIVRNKRLSFKLKFPLLVEIRAATLEEDADQIVKTLAAECSLIHQNIAACRVGEFVLTFGIDDRRIFAGAGSAGQFRKNFALRLAEVFYNLAYILKTDRNEFSIAEFSAYANILATVRPHLPADSKKSLNKLFRHVVRESRKKGFDYQRRPQSNTPLTLTAAVEEAPPENSRRDW